MNEALKLRTIGYSPRMWHNDAQNVNPGCLSLARDVISKQRKETKNSFNNFSRKPETTTKTNVIFD